MRKTIFMITMMLATATAGNAQGVLDKVKNKVNQEGSETTAQSGEMTSLDVVAATWQDGQYMRRRETGGMWKPYGKQEVKFHLDADGLVSGIEIRGDKFEAVKIDGASFVSEYTYRGSRLYVLPTSIVMYRHASGGVFPEEVYGEKVSISKIKKEIEDFMLAAGEIQGAQVQESTKNSIEAAEKAEAERFEKYSLEGKDVAKIEIINLRVPEKFGHFRGITFDLKATLKDGTVISTEKWNEGYRSDYTIAYDAANYKQRDLDGEILQSGFVDDDEITVTVTCKHHPSLKVSKTVQLKYNEDVSFNYRNGASMSMGNGGNAMNYRIEVKQVKHAKTGADLVKVRITNITEGETVSEFKMGIDQTLHFSCNGGKGGDDGRDFREGIGNGGNGGDITLIKDSNVKYFNLDYSNKGGTPGPAYGATYGRDGSYNEETRSVNL